MFQNTTICSGGTGLKGVYWNIRLNFWIVSLGSLCRHL